MESIKEALEYIANLATEAKEPQTILIDGKEYCKDRLIRCDIRDKAEPIKATTLTSLVDYIKECSKEMHSRMILQVESPTKVTLFSGLLEERDRETLFEANALLPRFEYGSDYLQEAFLVSLQSCFAHSEHREAVAVLASNIVNTQQATYSDDGISQQAVMKTGITTKEPVLVPNPVTLIPYRTFLEVEQPASSFIFRINDRGGAPAFKLTEADGGRWKSQAMLTVKKYLTEALADLPNREQITIIA